MKADYDRISKLLTDTVTLLCKNGLTYERELKVQGLLAVTLDTVDIFVVHINESFEVPSSSNAHAGSNEKSSSSSYSDKSAPRKRAAAASRPNGDFVDLTRIVETSQVDAPTFHGRNLQVRSQGSASANNSALLMRLSEPTATATARSRGITIGNCWPLCSGGPPLLSAPMHGRFSNSALQMRGLMEHNELLMLPENASTMDALFQTKQPSSLGLSGSAVSNRPLGPKNLQLPSLQWPYNSSFVAPNVAQNMQLGVSALQRYQMNSVDTFNFPSGTLVGSHIRAPLISARQRVMPNSAMSVGKPVFETQNAFQCATLNSRNGPVSRICDSSIAFNSSRIRYQPDWSVPQNNSVKNVSRSDVVSNRDGMVSSLIYNPPLPVVMCPPPYGEESNKSSLNISDGSFQHAVNSKSSCQTASAKNRKTLSTMPFLGIMDSSVPDHVLPPCGVVTIEPDGTVEDGDQGPASADVKLPITSVSSPITSVSSSSDTISQAVLTDEGMSKPVQELGLAFVQLPKEPAHAELSAKCDISKNQNPVSDDVEVDECEPHVDSDFSKNQNLISNESGVNECELEKTSDASVSVDINLEVNVSNEQSKQVEVDQVETSNYLSQESTTELTSANDICDSLKGPTRQEAKIDVVGTTCDGPSISTGDAVEGGASECISTDDDARNCPAEIESCATECLDKGESSVLPVDQQFEMPVLHSEASNGSIMDLDQPTLNQDLTFTAKNSQNTDSFAVHNRFISTSSVADSLRFLISTTPRCDTFACKVQECRMTYKIASDLAFHYCYQHPEVIARDISASVDLSLCKKRRSRKCLSVGNAYAKCLRSSTASKREYSEQTRGWRDFSLVRPHAPASKYARHRPKKFSCCLNECRQRYSSLKRLLNHLRIRHPDFQSNGWQMKSSASVLDTVRCSRNLSMSGTDFKLSLVRTVNSSQTACLASGADEADGKTCMDVMESETEFPKRDRVIDGPLLESAG